MTTMMTKADDPLLSDSSDEPAAPKKAKPKAKAKVKPEVKTKAKKPASNASFGRPASDETQGYRKKALQFAKAKNGVDNVSLAEKLGVTTAKSQSIVRPLVAAGQLKLAKDKATGRVTYQAR
jgi:hypothetical protein